MGFLKQTVICWLVLFVISCFTASSSAGLLERVLYTLIMAGLASVFLSYKKGQGIQPVTKNRMIAKKNKTLYIYENFAKQFKYRIENGRIFEGMNAQISYTIKENKIYEGVGGGTFLYRIEGNRVFKGFDRTPIYKVVDNKVYEGETSPHVKYILADSPTIEKP